jgi:hypothetical protein
MCLLLDGIQIAIATDSAAYSGPSGRKIQSKSLPGDESPENFDRFSQFIPVDIGRIRMIYLKAQKWEILTHKGGYFYAIIEGKIRCQNGPHARKGVRYHERARGYED